MKNWKKTSVLLMAVALTGCFGKDKNKDSESSSSQSSESSTHSSEEISSSSMLSSSSRESSESSTQISSSSSSNETSSSSSGNIDYLRLSEQIDTDISIQADSIENLGTALIGLVDQQAYRDFYLGLVAEGLDETAVSHAISVLGPVSTAIAADFIQKLSGQALLPAPEGIDLRSSISAIGDRGVEYHYTLDQEVNGVAVKLNLALRFEDQRPTLAALIDGRTGYNIFLDGLEMVATELSLASSEVGMMLLPGHSAKLSANKMVAEVQVTSDGNAITHVAFNGETLSVSMPFGTLSNGAVGVNASVEGTIEKLNATLDFATGSSSIEATQPNINVEMIGVALGG